MQKRKIKTVFLFLILGVFFSYGVNNSSETVKRVKEGAILHCWCWSFKTIKEHMPEIAQAGFRALQTSPINECRVGEGGGMDLMSSGNHGRGKWYYHYQPTDWKIGNYQLGSREEFREMCQEAQKYGIRVIVDVLPNHTTPALKLVSEELKKAAGGEKELYHANGQNEIRRWDDRLECTTGRMGGLPDVNTENPKFQKYFMTYMNDVIACGAGGFRFDTAKHIGLPDDPLDPKSKENDFWPIFTGQKAIDGVFLSNKDNLFLYGEVLQGGNAREKDYAEFLSVTASSYGNKLRQAVKTRNLAAKNLKHWAHPASGDRLVSWVESHDTYANQGESAGLSNLQLRMGYAVIAARKEGTPLFFSRPQGQEGVQFPGVSKIGDVGNDQFRHPEVVAVNHFRNAMAGEDEAMKNGETRQSLFIERGDRGVVILNFSEKPLKVDIETRLRPGEYLDKISGAKFVSSNGRLKGTVDKEKLAVLY